jgi:fumarylacetoacetase
VDLNETHDPARRSWVESANRKTTDFPIQNLPFGIFRRRDSAETFRGVVAIGDYGLDLRALHNSDLLTGVAREAAEASSESALNTLMALGPSHWSVLRREIAQLLSDGPSGLTYRAKLESILVPLSDMEFALPARIGDYTDFYAGIHHAVAVGKLFRPDNPLMPNYKWIPIGYHGRASSIVPSGNMIRRPKGQQKSAEDIRPRFAPSRRLDYELELGIFLGPGTNLGDTLTVDEARERIFGYCLLNDWSARDLQAWEYQPLGPFLAKNFATTVSPWIVTAEALAPYATNAFQRTAEDPQPLPHLASRRDAEEGGLDIDLEVFIATSHMRSQGLERHQLTHSNARYLYWTPAQMVAHHASNGCNLNAGDLLGTGTISGPDTEAAGSLLEMTGGGKAPVQLPSGEKRTFIEDGDEIIIRGRCERDGFATIGFGECAGTIIPA